jgi:hypothetical protein
MPVGQGYTNAFEKLRVVDCCGCGCVSVDFEHSGQDELVCVIADAVAVSPNGDQTGLMLWGREGRVTGLEIYDMTPGASRVLPSITMLRTWEELGEEMLRRDR